jgi:TorA maturation chaperone TorD
MESLMRASLYLLAATLFDEPRLDRRDDSRALLSRVIYRSPIESRWVPPLLEISDAHEHEERLRREHARLFVLAQPRVVAQPYGSFWLEPDRRLMGDTTIAMAQLMRRHSLAIDEHTGLLPDHLVSELEFMAYLAHREAAEDTRESQAILLGEHLGIWVPQFLAALHTCQPRRHYRMAAHYLNEVITWDLRRLAISSAPHPMAA